MGTRGRQTDGVGPPEAGAGAPARYRFRPRFRGLAITAAAIGAALLAAAAGFGLTGASLAFAAIAGGVGVVLGALYLGSPAWRLGVVVRDEALEVLDSRGQRRLYLPWAEIERVVASPSTHTCFVDGGGAERSLLLPGPGAQAPYVIEDREALFEAILARAPAERVEEVALLRDAPAPEEAAPAAGSADGGESEGSEEIGGERASGAEAGGRESAPARSHGDQGAAPAQSGGEGEGEDENLDRRGEPR